MCSGSGAGGYISLHTKTLIIHDSNVILNANGGGCDTGCTTGGAGSAGAMDIQFTTIYAENSPKMNETGLTMIVPAEAMDEHITINQLDGVCE